MTVTAEASHRGSAQSDRGGGPPRTPGRRPAAGSGLRTRPEATEPRLLHTEGRAHGSPAGGGSTRPAPDAELCEETGRRPHAGGPAARKGAPHGLWGRRQGPSSRTTTPPAGPGRSRPMAAGAGQVLPGFAPRQTRRQRAEGECPEGAASGWTEGWLAGTPLNPPSGGQMQKLLAFPGLSRPQLEFRKRNLKQRRKK